jgi:hypothetical protein
MQTKVPRATTSSSSSRPKPSRKRARTVPAIVADAGKAALELFAEFFTVNIDNENTRRATSETRSTSCAGARHTAFAT